MMARIDAAVIAAHQWIVDLLQMEPIDLVHWCAKVGCVLSLVRALLVVQGGVSDASGWLGIAMLPVNVAAFWFIARNIELFRGIVWARFYWVLGVVMPFSMDARGILTQAVCCAFMCSLYFGACDKPKPPRRKAATRLGLT